MNCFVAEATPPRAERKDSRQRARYASPIVPSYGSLADPIVPSRVAVTRDGSSRDARVPRDVARNATRRREHFAHFGHDTIAALTLDAAPGVSLNAAMYESRRKRQRRV